MAMKVDELMIASGEASYYTPEWRTVVESHLQWLLQSPNTSIVQLDPHDAFKYEADLTGLLLHMNVRAHLHYVVMRLNNMASPTDFDPEWTHLAIPNEDEIGTLMQQHLTLTKKFT